MSKSIRSFPKSEQGRVISRRLEKKTLGLGYWAAVDAGSRINKNAAEAAKKKAEQPKEETQ